VVTVKVAVEKESSCENVRSLIDAKIRGEELKQLGAVASAPPPVTDILEALKASLARVKRPVEVAQLTSQPSPVKRPRKAIAS
jgi:non-homologous end joining protein Ku